MANQFTYQVLKDTTEHAVIKLTGRWDSDAQEDNPHRISANSLYGALNANTTPGLLSDGGSALPFYGLSIHRVWYDTVNAQLNVWTASTWLLIGPQFTAGQGTSGAIVATVTDIFSIKANDVGTFIQLGDVNNDFTGSNFSLGVF